VKFRLKIGGPPSKPKYSLTTDSELVLRRKGEKNSCKESEIDLKLNAHKQSEEQSDDVPFVQGISDLIKHASLNLEMEAKRKRV
jgi:hypothetical protein